MTDAPGIEAVQQADGAPGAVARFPFDRMTVERFRAAFPQARWRDDLGAWFVPGTTAERRLQRWGAAEWSGVLAHADARGRDGFAFDPIDSPYLQAAEALLIRTPFSRTVVELLRAVPWAQWDGAEKLWRVPFRAFEELRRAWPAIEAAAQAAEPEARRARREARKASGEADVAAALTAERRRRRYPVPADALPPPGRVVMTHAGPMVFEATEGELADAETLRRFYPEVEAGEAPIWATWRRPTHAELVAAWPARSPATAADRARGWWQPTIEVLRVERKRAASAERARATRDARVSDADP